MIKTDLRFWDWITSESTGIYTRLSKLLHKYQQCQPLQLCEHPVYEIISQKNIFFHEWPLPLSSGDDNDNDIPKNKYKDNNKYRVFHSSLTQCMLCWNYKFPTDVDDHWMSQTYCRQWRRTSSLFLGDSVQHHSLWSCCPVCATPAFMNVTKRPDFGKIISTEFNPGRRTSTPEPIFAAYSFISSSVSAS